MEIFTTSDNQYRLEYSISPRQYSFYEYGNCKSYDKYLIKLDIKDISGITKVSIQSNEVEFARFINNLSTFVEDMYGWFDYYFNHPFNFTFYPDGNGNQINIRYGHDIPRNLIGNSDINNPDEDYLEEYLTFFVNRIDLYNLNVSNILHFKANIDEALDIALCGWKIMQDIPYSNELIYCDLLDYYIEN